MQKEGSTDKLKWEAWAERHTDPADVRKKDEALDGTTVLDLSQGNFAGLFCSSTLGEFGAKVIRVEPPGGDVARKFSPFGLKVRDTGFAYIAEARNKHHVTLNLGTEKGRKLLVSLARKADFLVETFPADYLDRPGIGYRQLSKENPGLIHIAINTFGLYGEEAAKGRKSSDVVAQAVSGLASITGFPGHPPLKAGIWIGDYYGALMSAVAILAAVNHRDRTGKGQFIDLAQSENLIRALDWTWVAYGQTGKNRDRCGNRDRAIVPAGVYRCADGFVAISALDDAEFRGLSKAMGKPGLSGEERFATVEARLVEAHADALHAMLTEWAAGRTVAEVERLGIGHAFGAAGVKKAEDHYRSAHLRERGSVWAVDDAIYGEVVEYGPVPKMSGTPGRIKWAGKPVGYDNEKVLAEILGYDYLGIKTLEQEGIIGKWSDIVGRKPPEEMRKEE